MHWMMMMTMMNTRMQRNKQDTQVQVQDIVPSLIVFISTSYFQSNLDREFSKRTRSFSNNHPILEKCGSLFSSKCYLILFIFSNPIPLFRLYPAL